MRTRATARPGPKAIIFDLDEALLDSRRAWQYAIEEAIASTCRRRVDAGPLAGEYRRRPWSHALAVLIDDPTERDRCEHLCREIFYRSGMKRLLVHDGIGMGLDYLRSRQVEIGAISREPHGVALKQIQSTGLDRFLTVLSATPEERWDAGNRFEDCLRFLGYEATACAFVSGDTADLRAVEARGGPCFAPGWLEPVPGRPVIPSPADIFPVLSAGPGDQAAASGSTSEWQPGQ